MDMARFNVVGSGMVFMGLTCLLIFEMMHDSAGQGSCLVGMLIVYFIHEYFKKKYFEKYPDKRPG